MRRPDMVPATAPTRATAATLSNMAAAHPVLPTGFTAGATLPSFTATYRQVQSEVHSFLAAGSPAGAGSAGTALTADGAALRARLAANRVVGGQDGGAVDVALQQAFLESIRPHAQEAAEKLGVAPELVAAHAALESGWGQHRLPGAQGGASHNLFGVKAGSQWQGAVAPATTTEFAHGVAVHKVESFRSYPSQAAAFRDYAQLLLDNPRYQQALHTGSDARAFARGLAAGGYATDPLYADKLASLARRLAPPGD